MGSGRHGAGIRSTSLDQRDTMSDVVILKDVVSDCLLKDALNYFKSIQCHEYSVNMTLIFFKSNNCFGCLSDFDSKPSFIAQTDA